MAKILNSLKFNGNVPKVIEQPDTLILNGQVYDKNSFSAKALDFCPINAGNRNEMYMYRTAYIDYQWCHNRNDQTFLADSNDPNIVYFATTGQYSTSAFWKIQKTSTGYNTYSISIGATNSEIMEFIGQDSTKIYVMMQRNYGSHQSYFGYIDKASFTSMTWVDLGNMSTIRVLKETESTFYCASMWEDRAYIFKYNKNTNAVTVLLDDYQTASDDYRCLATPMNSNGEFYIVKDAIISGGTVHKAMYRKYTLNWVSETVSFVDCTVDLSIKPNPIVPFTTSSNDGRIKHELFFVQDGGKTYLNHVVYNNGNAAIYLQADKCFLHTYEIVSSSNLKLVSWKEFNPIVYKAMMNMYDNKLLLLGHEGGVHFWSWNSSTKSFEKTTGVDAQIFAFGCDMNNNIYIQYQDTSVEMLSNTLPVTIYADFQYESYTYNGTDLDVTLEVYAKNFMDQYLNANIELTLFGPIRFADTGLKKKTVTTSNLNKLSIPVILSGEGLMKVNTKVI